MDFSCIAMALVADACAETIAAISFALILRSALGHGAGIDFASQLLHVAYKLGH